MDNYLEVIIVPACITFISFKYNCFTTCMSHTIVDMTKQWCLFSAVTAIDLRVYVCIGDSAQDLRTKNHVLRH